MTKPSLKSYRFLAQEALKLTWQRKSFWILGIFAGVLTSGGILDLFLHAYSFFRTEQTFLHELLSGSLPGSDWMMLLLEKTRTTPSSALSLILFFFVIVIFVFLFWSLMCQASLLRGLLEKKYLSWKKLFQKTFSALLPLLGIWLFTKAVTLLLLFLTSIPLALFFLKPTLTHGLLSFFILFAFFVFAVFLQFLSVFASIKAVSSPISAFNALHESFNHIRKHGFIIFEATLLLFFLTILASFVGMLFFAILLVPFVLLLLLSLFSGSTFLYLFFFGLGILSLSFFLFLFSGAITTFSYAWWVIFSKNISQTSSFSFLGRWFKKI